MDVRNNNGITLISLSITVIVLIIISGIFVNTSIHHIGFEQKQDLYTEIELLKSKVDEAYLKNGDVPIICNYLDKSNLQSVLQKNSGLAQMDGEISSEDGDQYAVIDLEKLEGLTLKYGYDEQYKRVKQNKTITNSNIEDDLYIINLKSHKIYYPKGVIADNYFYFTH